MNRAELSGGLALIAVAFLLAALLLAVKNNSPVYVFAGADSVMLTLLAVQLVEHAALWQSWAMGGLCAVWIAMTVYVALGRHRAKSARRAARPDGKPRRGRG